MYNKTLITTETIRGEREKGIEYKNTTDLGRIWRQSLYKSVHWLHVVTKASCSSICVIRNFNLILELFKVIR